MNHSGIKAMKRTWRPIRNGAFIFGLAMAVGACQRGEVEEGVPAAPTTPDTMDEGATTPIRDVDSIIDAPNRSANLNRQAELTNTSVQRVANDRVFWVGTATDRAIPVYLEDEARRSLPEDQPKLAMGDRVTLIGEIRRMPSKEDLQSKWNLTAEDAEQVSGAQVYVHATRITRVAEPTPGEPAGQPEQPEGQPAQPEGQPGQPPGQNQPGQPGEFRPGQPGQRQPAPSGELQPDTPRSWFLGRILIPVPGQPDAEEDSQAPGQAHFESPGQSQVSGQAHFESPEQAPAPGQASFEAPEQAPAPGQASFEAPEQAPAPGQASFEAPEQEPEQVHQGD
ncbi:MAG: hypothetical protein IPM54_08360 [Polyangiaceae bacterium]|nr:hypothetical protein [Polyangiaceae bacterium]